MDDFESVNGARTVQRTYIGNPLKRETGWEKAFQR